MADLDYDDDQTTTDNDGDGQDSSLIRQLRKQNRELQKQLSGLQDVQRKWAFTEAGFDLDSPEGKLLAKAYDGDELTADAIRTFAEEFGLTPSERQQQDTQEQQRVEAQQRGDRLRQTSAPEGQGQRMDQAQFLSLLKTNPSEARRVMDAGVVDVDPAVAAQLQANRQDRQRLLG